MNWVHAGAGIAAVGAAWLLNKNKAAKTNTIEILHVEISNGVIVCGYKDGNGNHHSAYQMNNSWYNFKTEDLLPDTLANKLTDLCLIWVRTNKSPNVKQIATTPTIIEAEGTK